VDECSPLRMAGDAIAALRESLKPEATVKREGRVYTMEATTLVPGRG